jgi:hypothetical protein
MFPEGISLKALLLDLWASQPSAWLAVNRGPIQPQALPQEIAPQTPVKLPLHVSRRNQQQQT